MSQGLIDEIAQSLANIMQADPNLMFRSALKVHNAMVVEYMKEVTSPDTNIKRAGAIRLRAELMQSFIGVLLTSGRINLTSEEKEKTSKMLDYIIRNQPVLETKGWYWT